MLAAFRQNLTESLEQELNFKFGIDLKHSVVSLLMPLVVLYRPLPLPGSTKYSVRMPQEMRFIDQNSTFLKLVAVISYMESTHHFILSYRCRGEWYYWNLGTGDDIQPIQKKYKTYQTLLKSTSILKQGYVYFYAQDYLVNSSLS
jgi:hypothetical protein